ncbi:hypothetical protein [Bifidobacterium bifidum]|uniref:Uncharacterized protein n=1 Tax=Bifidobacterium bifidum LMG 13195 TaxID=1207542 RepID=A0A286TFE7_BIFBI|nr:hypothetical protein [Bifidobacterium bifidum]MDB1202587.1 hypothetical protein [Bifidobacterium bifidum]BBA48989.1 hypothetical protein BBJK_02962 [Bifidobacterium bifidum LMG 13195]
MPVLPAWHRLEYAQSPHGRMQVMRRPQVNRIHVADRPLDKLAQSEKKKGTPKHQP